MLIYEDVYWNLERLFVELIERHFGIDNWLNSEIHATDIWAGDGLSKDKSKDARRKFFDEFLQLCGKFGLPFVFSFNLKHRDKDIHEKNLDMMRAALCLLTGIEHNLAEIHQTGVLISDASTNTETSTVKDISNMDITKTHISSTQALLRQFHEMTSWRSIRNVDASFTIPPKYQTEIMSAYLIDRVHFLPSNDILFLQMCDIMTFIIQRTLVYDYLLYVQKDRADQDKLPVSREGWAMMRNKLYPCCYDFEIEDVAFFKLNMDNTSGILFNFNNAQLPRNIMEHPSQLQVDL